MEVKLPDLPAGTTLAIAVVVQYNDDTPIEAWIKAIHDQTDIAHLRALYDAGCAAFSGDEAMLWAIRESTAAAKERLDAREARASVPSCFTPTQALIDAAPMLYRALREMVEQFDTLASDSLLASARAAMAAAEGNASTVN